MNDKAHVHIDNLIRYLEKVRYPREEGFDEAAQYISPRHVERSNVNFSHSDSHRSSGKFENFNPKPGDSCSRFSEGMQANLVPPSTPWLHLKIVTYDHRDNIEKSLRKLRHTTEQYLYDCLLNTNFYNVQNEIFTSIGVVGTAIVYVQYSNVHNSIRFYPRLWHEMYIKEDSWENLDCVLRKFEISAHDALQEFRSGIPEEKKPELEKADLETTVKINHFVISRDSMNEWELKDVPSGKYIGVYYNPEYGVIKMEGFDFMPYIVWRWNKASNDPYGFPPSHNALPDMKLTNAMMRSAATALHKLANPPIAVDKGMKGSINLRPGGVTFKDARDDAITSLPTGHIHSAYFEWFNVAQNRIGSAFRENFFTAITEVQRAMTAFEVAERQGEKVAILSSLINGANDEFIRPLIEILLHLLGRKHKLPIARVELSNGEFVVGNILQILEKMNSIGNTEYMITYIGPLAIMQKIYHEIRPIQQLLQSITPMAQINPEIFDKFDFDKALDIMVKVFRINSSVVRSDEEVAHIRQQRQQAMQEQQQMALIKDEAAAGKDIAHAKGIMEGVKNGKRNS